MQTYLVGELCFRPWPTKILCARPNLLAVSWFKVLPKTSSGKWIQFYNRVIYNILLVCALFCIKYCGKCSLH